jgi:protein ImuB
MKRFVSVWLPLWPIERIERAQPGSVPAEHPFAIILAGAKGLRLTALNAPARAAGLHSGQALADARAAVPHLLTRPAKPSEDRAALIALARWCGRYGPSRNIDGSDGLRIEITGAAHLFGGEEAVLGDLIGRFRTAGLTARAAIADTLGAAFALARYGSPLRCSAGPAQGGAREALAALPVEALRLASDSVLLLKRLGLRRIGQLYDLPRAALARRFRAAPPRRAGVTGQADAVLARLDQALGRIPEPLEPLVEPPVHCVRRAFADPLVSPESVTAEVSALAGRLCRELEAAAQGARHVRLCLYRADGTWAETEAGTSTPCREPSHMVGLLAEKLATLDAGFGIDVITLDAMLVELLGRSQTSLSNLARHSRADPASLIDRLANRLGADRIARLVACESYIPERGQHLVPALISGVPSRTPQEASPVLAPRPPFLLRRPEPISVVAEVPEGPPARFTWRRLGHRIVKAEGPERIAPEWWRELGASRPSRPRDYYRIEDAGGGRYWVFRAGLFGGEAEEEAPQWFMHGVFG